MRTFPQSFTVLGTGLCLFALFALAAPALGAQDTGADGAAHPAGHGMGHDMAHGDAVGQEMLRHFDGSMRKFIALAEAMPADLWSWSPGEGVMSVERVYAHVTRYNYMYLADNLGIPAPSSVDVGRVEEITGKDALLPLMRASHEHVLEQIEKSASGFMDQGTRLYGRDVEGWAVMVQLVAHMNEHLGQSIAYARMNGVTPPWSG